MGSSSRTRAEPKIVTAGRSILSTASKPRRNSSAMSATWRARSSAFSSLERMPRSSTLETALVDVRADHPEEEQQHEHAVEDADLDGAVGAAPGDRDRIGAAHRELLSRRRGDRVAGEADRVPDGAPVEDPDRYEVDQVEEESGVGQRAQQVGVHLGAERPAGRRAETARRRPGESDERVLPGVERRVLDQHVGAEEGDEGWKGDVETLPPGLEVVPHLVHEDEQDEPDRETPSPDQRVAADGDEDAQELEDREPELEHEPDHHGERRPDLLQEALPGRLRVDRPVASLVRGLLVDGVEQLVAGAPVARLAWRPISSRLGHRRSCTGLALPAWS